MIWLNMASTLRECCWLGDRLWDWVDIMGGKWDREERERKEMRRQRTMSCREDI